MRLTRAALITVKSGSSLGMLGLKVMSDAIQGQGSSGLPLPKPGGFL